MRARLLHEMAIGVVVKRRAGMAGLLAGIVNGAASCVIKSAAARHAMKRRNREVNIFALAEAVNNAAALWPAACDGENNHAIQRRPHHCCLRMWRPMAHAKASRGRVCRRSSAAPAREASWHGGGMMAAAPEMAYARNIKHQRGSMHALFAWHIMAYGIKVITAYTCVYEIWPGNIGLYIKMSSAFAGVVSKRRGILLSFVMSSC